MNRPAIRCRVINSRGEIYWIGPAPDDKEKVILQIHPVLEYTFPSRSRARSAVAHTMDYLTARGRIWNKGDFQIVNLEPGEL